MLVLLDTLLVRPANRDSSKRRGLEPDCWPAFAGHGCHYDYKPYRPVGSFLSFIFAVVPLSNYTTEAGPLLLSPRSHLRTRVLPSDGRVHSVEVACVPPLEDIELVDPNIGLGDVVFMHCYCWHAYCPNTSEGDRFGLYMKFHPKSSPPSNGPLLHPHALSELLSPNHSHLVPYTCPDARYYSDSESGLSINEGMQTIGRTALLLEDQTGRVLLQRKDETDGSNHWGLPSCEVTETKGGYMDNSNVIGQLSDFASSAFGLELRWMSWIADNKIQQQSGAQHPYQVERVYAHQLGRPGTNQSGNVLVDAKAELAKQRPDLRWFSLEELRNMDAKTFAAGGMEAQWVRMWQCEEDEDGQPVRRGYGFPLSTGGKFGCTIFAQNDPFSNNVR
eukprot:COSAG02_NODE_38_length_48090_cov_107.207060_7_plen_389_part_00